MQYHAELEGLLTAQPARLSILATRTTTQPTSRLQQAQQAAAAQRAPLDWSRHSDANSSALGPGFTPPPFASAAPRTVSSSQPAAGYGQAASHYRRQESDLAEPHMTWGRPPQPLPEQRYDAPARPARPAAGGTATTAANYGELLSPGTRHIAAAWQIAPTQPVQPVPMHPYPNLQQSRGGPPPPPAVALHAAPLSSDLDDSIDFSVLDPPHHTQQHHSLTHSLDAQNAQLQLQRRAHAERMTASHVPSGHPQHHHAGLSRTRTHPPPTHGVSTSAPVPPAVSSAARGFLRPEDDPDEDVQVSSSSEDSDQGDTRTDQSRRHMQRSVARPQTSTRRERLRSASPPLPSPREGRARRRRSRTRSPPPASARSIGPTGPSPNSSSLRRVYELLDQNQHFYSSRSTNDSTHRSVRDDGDGESTLQRTLVREETSPAPTDEASVHVHVHVHATPSPRAPLGASTKCVAFQGTTGTGAPAQQSSKGAPRAMYTEEGQPDQSTAAASAAPASAISMDDLNDTLLAGQARTKADASSRPSAEADRENRAPHPNSNNRRAPDAPPSMMSITRAPVGPHAARQDRANAPAQKSTRDVAAEQSDSDSSVSASLRTLKSRRPKPLAPFEPNSSCRRPGPGGAAGAAPSPLTAHSSSCSSGPSASPEAAQASDVGIFMPSSSRGSSSSANKLALNSTRHASAKTRITGHTTAVLARLNSVARAPPKPSQCAVSLLGSQAAAELAELQAKHADALNLHERAPSPPPTHPARTTPLPTRPLSSPKASKQLPSTRTAHVVAHTNGSRSLASADSSTPSETPRSTLPTPSPATLLAPAHSQGQQQQLMQQQQRHLQHSAHSAHSAVHSQHPSDDESEGDELEVAPSDPDPIMAELMRQLSIVQAGNNNNSTQPSARGSTRGSVRSSRRGSVVSSVASSGASTPRTLVPLPMQPDGGGTPMVLLEPRMKDVATTLSPAHFTRRTRTPSQSPTRHARSASTQSILTRPAASVQRPPIMRAASLPQSPRASPGQSQHGSPHASGNVSPVHVQGGVGAAASSPSTRVPTAAPSMAPSMRSSRATSRAPSRATSHAPSRSHSRSHSRTRSELSAAPSVAGRSGPTSAAHSIAPSAAPSAAPSMPSSGRHAAGSSARSAASRSHRSPELPTTSSSSTHSRAPSIRPAINQAHSRSSSWLPGASTAASSQGGSPLSSPAHRSRRSTATGSIDAWALPAPAAAARSHAAGSMDSSSGLYDHAMPPSVSQQSTARSMWGPESRGPSRSVSVAPSAPASPRSGAQHPAPGPATAATADVLSHVSQTLMQSLLSMGLQQDPKARDLAQGLLASMAQGAVSGAASAAPTPPYHPRPYGQSYPHIPPLQLPVQTQAQVQGQGRPASHHRRQSSVTFAESNNFAPSPNSSFSDSPTERDTDASATSASAPPTFRVVPAAEGVQPTPIQPTLNQPPPHSLASVMAPRPASTASSVAGLSGGVTLPTHSSILRERSLNQAQQLLTSRPKPAPAPLELRRRPTKEAPKEDHQATGKAGTKASPAEAPCSIAQLAHQRIQSLRRLRAQQRSVDSIHAEQIEQLWSDLRATQRELGETHRELEEDALYQMYVQARNERREAAEADREHAESSLLGVEGDGADRATGADASTDGADSELDQAALIHEVGQTQIDPRVFASNPAVQSLAARVRLVRTKMAFVALAHAAARSRLQNASVRSIDTQVTESRIAAAFKEWRELSLREQSSSTTASGHKGQGPQRIRTRRIPSHSDARVHMDLWRQTQALRKLRVLGQRSGAMRARLAQLLAARSARSQAALYHCWRARVLAVYRDRMQEQLAQAFCERMRRARDFRAWRLRASRERFLFWQLTRAMHERAEQAQLQEAERQRAAVVPLLMPVAPAPSAPAAPTAPTTASATTTKGHFKRDTATSLAKQRLSQQQLLKLKKTTKTAVAAAPVKRKPAAPAAPAATPSATPAVAAPAPPSPLDELDEWERLAPALSKYFLHEVRREMLASASSPSGPPPPATAAAAVTTFPSVPGAHAPLFEALAHVQASSSSSPAAPLWLPALAHSFRAHEAPHQLEQLRWIQHQLHLRVEQEAQVGWLVRKYNTQLAQRADEEESAVARRKAESARLNALRGVMKPPPAASAAQLLAAQLSRMPPVVPIYSHSARASAPTSPVHPAPVAAAIVSMSSPSSPVPSHSPPPPRAVSPVHMQLELPMRGPVQMTAPMPAPAETGAAAPANQSAASLQPVVPSEPQPSDVAPSAAPSSPSERSAVESQHNDSITSIESIAESHTSDGTVEQPSQETEEEAHQESGPALDAEHLALLEHEQAMLERAALEEAWIRAQMHRSEGAVRASTASSSSSVYGDSDAGDSPVHVLSRISESALNESVSLADDHSTSQSVADWLRQFDLPDPEEEEQRMHSGTLRHEREEEHQQDEEEQLHDHTEQSDTALEDESEERHSSIDADRYTTDDSHSYAEPDTESRTPVESSRVDLLQRQAPQLPQSPYQQQLLSLTHDGQVDVSRLDLSGAACDEHHLHVHHFPADVHVNVDPSDTRSESGAHVGDVSSEAVLQQLHTMQGSIAEIQHSLSLSASFHRQHESHFESSSAPPAVAQPPAFPVPQTQQPKPQAVQQAQQPKQHAAPVHTRPRAVEYPPHDDVPESALPDEPLHLRRRANLFWAQATHAKVFRAWLTRVLLQHLERRANRHAHASGTASTADTSALSAHASSSDPELSAALSDDNMGAADSSAANNSSLQSSFHSTRTGRPIDPALLKPVYPELLPAAAVKQQLEQSILDAERMEGQQAAYEDPVRDTTRTVRFAPSVDTSRSSISSHRSRSRSGSRSPARVAPAAPLVDPNEVPLDDLMFAHFKRADRRAHMQLERILLKTPAAHAISPPRIDPHTALPLQQPQPQCKPAPASSPTEVPSAYRMAPSDLRDLIALEHTATKHEEFKDQPQQQPAHQPSQQPQQPPERSLSTIQPTSQKRSALSSSGAPLRLPAPAVAPRAPMSASSLSLAAFTDLSFSPGSSFGFGSAMPSFDTTAASTANTTDGADETRVTRPPRTSTMLPLNPTPVEAAVLPGPHPNSSQPDHDAGLQSAPLAIDPFRPPPRPLPRLAFNFTALSKPAQRR